MPTISRFYGLVIFMNYRDHDPPHFHVRYQDQEAIVFIETGQVRGDLTRRALSMVFEWLDVHRAELMDNWERARAHQPLLQIPPLP